MKLRLSDPMLLDDVAADFPGLTVILAHPSVPWADSAISMATHKSNVFIDLSGWSPKYFPADLVRAANSYLQDKVLFGTDYPLLTPERWLRDFETLDLKPDASQDTQVERGQGARPWVKNWPSNVKNVNRPAPSATERRVGYVFS